MHPMPFSRRRRERKAVRVARLLVALDEAQGRAGRTSRAETASR